MSIWSRTRRVRVAASCISPTPTRSHPYVPRVANAGRVKEHRDILARGALTKGTRVPAGNRGNRHFSLTDLSVMSKRKSVVLSE